MAKGGLDQVFGYTTTSSTNPQTLTNHPSLPYCSTITVCTDSLSLSIELGPQICIVCSSHTGVALMRLYMHVLSEQQ